MVWIFIHWTFYAAHHNSQSKNLISSYCKNIYQYIYINKKKTKKNIQMDCHWKRKRHSYSNSSHYRKIIQLYATLDTCICRFSIAQYVTLNTSACRFRKVQYVTLDTCTCRFSKAQYATLDTSSCHFGKIQYVTLDTSTCNFGKTQLP